MRRNNVDVGYVSVYNLNLETDESHFNIKRFDSADEDWLNFVVNNRKGESLDNCADLLIGPVADDNVYQSIRLFETGAYDAEYTIKRLKTEVLHDQWVVHTERILEYLVFVEAKEIR